MPQLDRILFKVWLMTVSLALTAYGTWALQLAIQSLNTPLLGN